MQKIKFRGKDYILVNNSSITTPERYRNGIVSYARLTPKGIITQYGVQIGIKSDIKFLDKIEDIEITYKGILNMTLGRGWLWY
jgi:hypothetical protein